MTDFIDDTNTASFYSELLKKHGVSFKSLDWGSVESQEKRFKVLSEIGFKNGDSILDIGCGIGDLYSWLNKNGFRVNYTGVDITISMVDKARERFPKVDFRHGSVLGNKVFLPETDYVVASGIFFLRKHNPTEYMQRSIIKMFNLARKGVAINSLSSWHKNKNNEFYADPGDTLNFCQRLTSRVILRHDYHEGDFTIYLYKYNT